jgi:hypothetical protein
VDATIPKVPRSSGLVVKVTSQNLRVLSTRGSILGGLDDLDDPGCWVLHHVDAPPEVAKSF